MKAIRKAIAIIAGLCVLVALFITILDFAAFDHSFYPKEYAKYNNAEVIGISDEELMEATNVLLDYIQNKRADMIVEATIKGEVREVFNQRETEHMVDVQNLYLNAIAVRNGCAIFAVIAIGYLCITKKERGIVESLNGYISSCGVFLAILLGVGFYAYVDFYRFWTLFHQLLFTNDLWLLNPNTDIMIMMVPEGFFYDLVFKIVLLFIAWATLLFGLSIIGTKKMKGVKA